MVAVALASLLADPNFGIFRQDSTEIDGLVGVIDQYPDEFHAHSLSTTNYPIETGATLTDHAYLEPYRLTLKAIVSDLAPLVPGIVSIAANGRPTEALQRARSLLETREPVRVVTLLGVREDMLITGLYPSTSRRTGRALYMDITLEQVIFAETQLVELPPATVNQDSPAANKTSTVEGGLKQSEEATASSLLNSIAEFF